MKMSARAGTAAQSNTPVITPNVRVQFIKGSSRGRIRNRPRRRHEDRPKKTRNTYEQAVFQEFGPLLSTFAFQLENEFEVLPDLGCLRRVDGDEIALRPKTFQALLFLIRNRQRLVTKEELTSHLWPDTAVTDDALVQCIVELRKALGDAAREPRFVRTVPKLGYRFVGNVRESAADEPQVELPVSVAVAPQVQTVATPLVRSSWPLWPVAISLAIVVVAAVIFISDGTPTETAALDPASGKPGIAVMYLDNQSHTEALDWMREGLAEMLITGLSQSDRVNVLGRKHLQTLLDRVSHSPGQEIALETARDVARRAQANYVLMGSFARLGEKIRIDVHIESVDAKRVASETITVDRLEDVLTQVDQLARKLATHFGGVPSRPADVAASGLTTDIDAYRAYSLGVSKAIAYHSEEAIELFKRALELDPKFVMARARLGYVYGVTWPQGDIALPYLEEAFKHADRLRESDRLYIEAWYAIARSDFAAAISPLQRLVRLYPYEIEAHNRLARLLLGERRVEDAIEVTRHGLSIDSESTDLLNTLGGAYAQLGRYADAVATHRRYVALAPSEPNSYDSLGLSLQAAGRYEEAEAAYNRALELKPGFELAVAHLANVYFQIGRYSAAQKLYERYIAEAKTSGERGRGYTALTIIQVRHGRRAEAAKSAAAADLESRRNDSSEQLWGSLNRQAMMQQPLESLPTRAHFTTENNRGSRASMRWYLWLEGQDAMARGNTAAALDAFRQAMRESPIYWSIDPAEDGLALAFIKLGRWDEAIAELGRVLQANPNYPRAHYFLARAYEGKGQMKPARDALQQFLTVWSAADGDIPEVIDARKRLARLES